MYIWQFHRLFDALNSGKVCVYLFFAWHKADLFLHIESEPVDGSTDVTWFAVTVFGYGYGNKIMMWNHPA